MDGEGTSAVGRPRSDGSSTSRVADVTLYVFPGSHACRSGMLLLDHKGIDYRRVDLVPGLHPLSVRVRGFPGHRAPIRSVDGRTHRALGILDRVGTVPALRYGGQKIQGNREIARFLERAQPDPPLFPADPGRRLAVEEAERWGDEQLQMAARRIVIAASLCGLDQLRDRGGRGRLGPLLSENATIRMLASRAAGHTFRVTPAKDGEMLQALPGMLDKVDSWIGAGVLDGEQLNAADLMIAPSLALLTYRRDLRQEIESRPAGALVERVLPEPDVPGG